MRTSSTCTLRPKSTSRYIPGAACSQLRQRVAGELSKASCTSHGLGHACQRHSGQRGSSTPRSKKRSSWTLHCRVEAVTAETRICRIVSLRKRKGLKDSRLIILDPADVQDIRRGLIKRGLIAHQDLAGSVGVRNAQEGQHRLALGNVGVNQPRLTVGGEIVAQIAFLRNQPQGFLEEYTVEPPGVRIGVKLDSIGPGRRRP